MATNPKRETDYRNSKSYSVCRQRYNPCALWSSFCSWYVCLLSRFFGWFGQGIATHPLLTISICIMFVGACSVGLLWFTVEDRRNKLFIPQQSQALDDLNAAEKYFRVKFRTEEILLVASSSHPNVLSPNCLMQALKAHDAVVHLDSYSDFCVTLSGEKAESSESCMMINPLEIFHFNQTNLINKELREIQGEVNKAYNNPTPLMRNGRPFQYNFNRMFGKVTRNDTTNEIISAKALQLVYFIRDPSEREANLKILEWEKTFIDKMATLEKDLTCFEFHYSTERSLDDAIAESSGSDVTLVSITFTIMITFSFFVLGKFLNPLTSHSLLASAGVFAVILGIVGGSGLAMWCRVPFVSIVGVLPFLVLGIGIDDMFIIVDELDRQPRQLTVVNTVKEVMSRSGSSVTMTTVTDLVAFAVSTSTSFPAVRYFCVYAALMVTISFLMMVTFFVGIMTYDIKRIKAGRRDCLPFCRVPPQKQDRRPWDEPLPQTSNRIMLAWAKFLTFTPTKIFVVIFSVGFLAAGIYGVTQVDESFDRRILAKDGTYLKRFLFAQEDNFELSIEVSIVVEGEVDYGKQSRYNEIRELSNIVKSNKHYRNATFSWMDAFSQYANKKNITELNFVTELKTFLNVSQHFRQDVKFSHDGENVKASRILGFMKASSSSTFQKDAMLSLRQDLEQNLALDVFPIARPFIVFEQYAIVSRETTRNLIIAAIAVFIVTSPFMVDCTVTLIVSFNFVALICELFGLMVLWDVALNTVSMINLVMAIGFAVDYSAHIAHAYVISQETTANERVVDSLSTVGASVFMGGFSTFLGMVVLAFAASELFRIFFKMFLGIVVFGLVHGLCILPVYLSLFCRRPTVIRPSSTLISVESKNPSHNAPSMAPGAVFNGGFETGDPCKAIERNDAVHTEGGQRSRTEPQINTTGSKKGSIKEAGIQNKGFQRDDALNRPDDEAMKMAEHQNDELQTDSKKEKKQQSAGEDGHQENQEADEITLMTDNIDTNNNQETTDSNSDEPAEVITPL